MSELNERLKKAREALGISKSELARRAGCDPSAINHLESGKTKSLSGKLAVNIPRVLGISAVWLSEGKGEMKSPSPMRFRAVQTSETAIDVPVMNAIGSMGIGKPLPEHDAVVDHVRVARQWVSLMFPSISNAKNLAVIAACGDSMRPTFDDGDMLLVDTGVTEIKIDAVYVLALGDELYIKRLQRRPDGAFLMISDNRQYDPYPISDIGKQELRVLGRVLWAWNGRKL
jgi:phage repressor protein C with HTH and peptisase S24 domain